MSDRWEYRWIVGGLFLVATVLWAAWPTLAAEDAQQEPAEKPAEEQPAEEQPAEEQPDPYKVPDGTPAELVEFVDGLMGTPPPSVEARQKAIAAMLEAADKILAGKPDQTQAERAVQVKILLLRTSKELEEFAAQLKKADRPKLARKVQGSVLGRRLRETARASREDREGIAKLIEEIEHYLAEGPLDPTDAGLAMTAGRVAETTGDEDLITKTYTTFAELFSASDDPAVASSGKRLAGVLRRLTLVGKKMKLEGTLLAGEALDWSKYLGKVVLVDFWATWCGPCVREVPNMIKNYEAYHDRGFEVVGISLDRSREPLEKFVEERQIPWTIVHDMPSPMADYYGVMGIPTMILVGRDGNVVSTTARGPKLDETLEKLLGPVEKDKDAEEDDAEKDGAKTAETPDKKG